MITFAIALAVLGAFGLAVGMHVQHRAIAVGTASSGRSMNAGVAKALTNPLWLLGGGIIVVVIVLNIVALGLAPVAVVQPVGVLALVCAVIISARALRVNVNRGLVLGIVIVVASVGVFVGISTGFALEVRPSQETASQLAWLLLCLSMIGLLVAHQRTGHLARVVTAGTVYGGVASAMHVVAVEGLALLREVPAPPVATGGFGMPGASEDAVSMFMLCTLVVLLLIATVIGAWLVQTAYASGPPETVLAGLTVIDPLVAVMIGAFLLGEYAPIPSPAMIGLLCSGAAACAGIAIIVRHHPTIKRAPSRPLDAAPPAALSAEIVDTGGIVVRNGRS